MAQLKLEAIDKNYGEVRAVKGISLDVPEGQFLALVGPSGCGKSTLLRCIAGLEDISSGEILMDGRTVTRLAPRARNIAMVLQSYALYPYLTVYENIAFGLRARKVDKDTIAEKVTWAADMLHIADYLDRKPRELSGGQRQRIAIGRAIVRDADLYLFDEPLSNLDAKLRDGMREEIKRLHQILGKTFIYVTHDQIEAMTLADRIILMRDGQIEQTGAPLDLFDRPANTFVAQFLGSPKINLLDVKLQDRNILVLADGQSVKLPNAPEIPDGPYLWGVRPEHFKHADTGMIKADVVIAQPTGARTFLTLAMGSENITAELGPHVKSRPGDQVCLDIDIKRTLFFDKESGLMK